MPKFVDHIGLEVGSSSVKIVQLAPLEGGKFRLVALGQVESAKLENEVEWNAARTQLIKRLVSDAHVSSKQAAISLPESQVYTRVIRLPYLEEPELSQAISWQAEQYVPIPLTDVVLKHQVLSLPEQGVAGSKMSVLLLAAPNVTIATYLSLVSGAGLEAVAIETEMLAIIRALTPPTGQFPQSLIIHIGAETTTFSIYHEGVFVLTQSIGTGGLAMTRSISTELGLDMVQAEQYKRTYGLDETKLDGKVASAIKSVADFILNESKRVLASYESQNGSEPVRRVVLSGGGSILSGIVSAFANVLPFEVALADPFLSVAVSSDQRLAIGETGPSFCVAVGLAMKQLS